MAVPAIALDHVRSGKVRDLYRIGDDRLLLIASDRVSTYDCVHPTPIPDKGRVLTGLSVFWFQKLADVVPAHLVSASTADLPEQAQEHAEELRGRMMLVREVEIVPFECVVRGYLAGSGWREYQDDGTVCGVGLPEGLEEGSELPTPIFTPATKAESGHDENVTFRHMADAVGWELAGKLRETAIELYRRAQDHARERGVILADTKFEFGLLEGEVVLADEVLTPDSSRYWPADEWAPGHSQPSFDKQFVRDYGTSTGWDRNPPAPELPPDIVTATREKYVEVYERLTGESFDEWLRDGGPDRGEVASWADGATL
ncbi:MAG: phosphoribosylaminoimidazolesuccinocarboxamide synthase [Nitriliruptorales bacterium]|nr:phosphoribosylaminoimidazolesuccinocarboxamide synthase [Nitriliruptorales bacterium]